MSYATNPLSLALAQPPATGSAPRNGFEKLPIELLGMVCEELVRMDRSSGSQETAVVRGRHLVQRKGVQHVTTTDGFPEWVVNLSKTCKYLEQEVKPQYLRLSRLVLELAVDDHAWGPKRHNNIRVLPGYCDPYPPSWFGDVLDFAIRIVTSSRFYERVRVEGNTLATGLNATLSAMSKMSKFTLIVVTGRDLFDCCGSSQPVLLGNGTDPVFKSLNEMYDPYNAVATAKVANHLLHQCLTATNLSTITLKHDAWERKLVRNPTSNQWQVSEFSCGKHGFTAQLSTNGVTNGQLVNITAAGDPCCFLNLLVAGMAENVMQCVYLSPDKDLPVYVLCRSYHSVSAINRL